MSAASLLRRLVPLAAVALLAADLPAQLFTSSTHRKDKPPYYHGKRPDGGATIAWTPIVTPSVRAWRTRSGEAPSAQMQMLLDTLNTRLAELMGDSPRMPDERAVALLDEAPDVRFGCPAEFSGQATRVGRWYHSAGCEDPKEGEGRYNALIVTQGSKKWKGRAATAMAQDSAQLLLLLSLEVSDQYPWSGWRGKGVRLGTGYDVSLPWLSAVDRPVTVVQLVGTIVNHEGKVVRSGAEGLYAAKPGALTTLLGGQQAVSDRQLVEILAGTRRDDLPGTPPVWEVALRTLVSELTNRDPVAIGSR